MNPFLDEALKYAASGHAVFPLKPNAKTPLTAKGHLDASTDPEQIRAWWTKYPTANVGMATGKISGITVLDVDVKNQAGGDNALKALTDTNGPLPETPQQFTWSGGWQNVYTYEPGVKNSAGKLGKGLDVRGDGGYVVVPPSVVNGRAYEWAVNAGLDETPLKPMPWWMVDALRPREGVSSNPPGWVSDLLANGSPNGQRDEDMTKLIGYFVRLVVDDTVIAAIMDGWVAKSQYETDPPGNLQNDFEKVREKIVRIRAMEAARAEPNVDADGVVFRTFDEIREEEIDWLWPSHLARGSVTLLCGDIDLGKSKVTLDLASRHSRGRPWPDGTPGGRAGVTIILSAEDHAGYTIKPRLTAMDADYKKVVNVEAVRVGGKERQLSLDTDLTMLESLVEATGADLIIIDPLNSYLGKADSWKDSEIRRVLGPLAKFSERAGVAIIGLVHLTKSTDRKALMRIQGSVAFPAFARLVFGVTENPAVEGERILVSMKANICAKPPGMTFAHDGMGIKWGNAFTVSSAAMEDLFRPQRPAPKLDKAKALLRDLAQAGVSDAAEILERAKEQDIDDNTIRRARAVLGFRTVRTGFGPGARFRWEPPQDQAEA